MADAKTIRCMNGGHEDPFVHHALVEDPKGNITERCLRHRIQASVNSRWYVWGRTKSLTSIPDMRRDIQKKAYGYLNDWMKAVRERYGSHDCLTAAEEKLITDFLGSTVPTAVQLSDHDSQTPSETNLEPRSRARPADSVKKSKKRRRSEPNSTAKASKSRPHLSPGPPDYVDPPFSISLAYSPKPERPAQDEDTPPHEELILCQCGDLYPEIDFQQAFNPTRPYAQCLSCRAEFEVSENFKTRNINLKEIYERKSKHLCLPDLALRDEILDEYRVWYEAWEGAMRASGHKGVERRRPHFEKFVSTCVGDFWRPTPSPEPAERNTKRAKEIRANASTVTDGSQPDNAHIPPHDPSDRPSKGHGRSKRNSDTQRLLDQQRRASLQSRRSDGRFGTDGNADRGHHTRTTANSMSSALPVRTIESDNNASLNHGRSSSHVRQSLPSRLYRASDYPPVSTSPHPEQPVDSDDEGFFQDNYEDDGNARATTPRLSPRSLDSPEPEPQFPQTTNGSQSVRHPFANRSSSSGSGVPSEVRDGKSNSVQRATSSRLDHASTSEDRSTQSNAGRSSCTSVHPNGSAGMGPPHMSNKGPTQTSTSDRSTSAYLNGSANRGDPSSVRNSTVRNATQHAATGSPRLSRHPSSHSQSNNYNMPIPQTQPLDRSDREQTVADIMQEIPSLTVGTSMDFIAAVFKLFESVGPDTRELLDSNNVISSIKDEASMKRAIALVGALAMFHGAHD